jgi:hypothetical protein
MWRERSVMIAPLALWRRFDGDETAVFLGVSILVNHRYGR